MLYQKDAALAQDCVAPACESCPPGTKPIRSFSDIACEVDEKLRMLLTLRTRPKARRLSILVHHQQEEWRSECHLRHRMKLYSFARAMTFEVLPGSLNFSLNCRRNFTRALALALNSDALC